MINPFIGYTIPVEGSRLVGRSEKINEIQKCLLDGASCCLSGLRRIGKTSVALQVKKNIELSNPQIKTCYIALNTITSESDFYKVLVKKLFSQKDKKIIPQDILGDTDDLYLMYMRLCEYLQDEASENNFNGIVVIDELDSIAHQIPNANILINRIRELINSRSVYHLTFLFVSAKSIQWLQDNTADVSTLSGICQPFSLKPFGKNTGLADLLKRANIESSDFLDALFHITGGHPYLASALLYSYFEIKENDLDASSPVIPDSDLLFDICLQRNCKGVFLPYYKNLKTFFSSWKEEKIWDALCNVVVGPCLEEPAANTIDLLKTYGVITEEGLCFSDDFRDYLELQCRQAPLWNMIRNVETLLRQLVKDVFEKRIGSNWIIELKQKPDFVALFENMEIIMRKEQKQFNTGNFNNILEYSYLGDLKVIIVNYWSWFQMYLGDSKSKFIQRMDCICKIRNPLAHNRKMELIPYEDRIMAEQACSKIEEAILQQRSKKD